MNVKKIQGKVRIDLKYDLLQERIPHQENNFNPKWNPPISGTEWVATQHILWLIAFHAQPRVNFDGEHSF
jgi:hypothetical protein